MKLLVFGSTGQVARELKRLAPEATYLSRDEVDLTKPVSCADAIRKSEFDAVINVAAFTAVDKAEDDEETARHVNGDAPAAMAKAAASCGIPFLHVSTDYVFDGKGIHPWKPYDRPDPIGAYGRSKLSGEQGVLSAGGCYAVLRTSWVFSSHGANFAKTMLRLGKTRNNVSVVEDQVGGPTPAADIAATLLLIAQSLRRTPAASGIYHYSGAPDVSWADFAREIFRQSSMPVNVVGIPSSAFPTPARRPANSRLDCTSTQSVFAIDRPDWRAGLTRVLHELGEN